ncbi:DUF1573 domain-containing protein [Schlesneria paludicola]|uniref:DUF1573 domain-containing protein n=1 Tax=Schlesneria paludicola TaxID=360056 RepID=UPI00029AC316
MSDLEQRIKGFRLSIPKSDFGLLLLSLVVLFVLVVGFAWIRTGSPTLVWPWLQGLHVVFEPRELVFDGLTVGKVRTSKFRVTNISSSNVTLLGIESSCACISLDQFPKSIEPGGVGTLDVVLQPRAAGTFHRKVRVFTDVEGEPPALLTIVGTVN